MPLEMFILHTQIETETSPTFVTSSTGGRYNRCQPHFVYFIYIYIIWDKRNMENSTDYIITYIQYHLKINIERFYLSFL